MNTINPFTDPIHGIALALSMTFSMFWEILWALILGFTLSGIVQAVVSNKFNYTTVLNFVFLALAALLIARFLKTGGPDMLRMMDNSSEHEHHEHHHHSMH